ncbi:MAG: hypothetical protein E7632_12545 [Ruminococcaceae bacterium]|nr:hypothetical protein [Oscillospiraceae bacterium]
MINFGKRIEPMTDRYLIESMDGCAFMANPPEKEAEAIRFDKPWERAGSTTVTAFDENGTVKLYYRGFPEEVANDGKGDFDERQAACLAESTDGIHFERIPVNEIDYFGSRENNIVEIGRHCHNFAPFLDTNPDCRPDEKYKAISGMFKEGIRTWASPDGIHWHPLSDGYVITRGYFDTFNIAFYDSYAKKYRCYSRDFANGIRVIQSSESEDFVHWSEPVHNIYPGLGEITEHLYTNATTPIPGAEHMLLSMPMRFHETRKLPVGNVWPFPGLSDMVMMTSRDGVHWDRTIREPWIYPSLDPREWTQRGFIASSGIIERGDKFLFYIQRHYMWDDCGIWVYSIPRYRFMSVGAGWNGGRIVTKELAFETDTVHLNYQTSVYGSIRVKALNAEGQIVGDSGEIFGNELSRPVTLAGIAGTCGRLVIELCDAKLYAIGGAMRKETV